MDPADIPTYRTTGRVKAIREAVRVRTPTLDEPRTLDEQVAGAPFFVTVDCGNHGEFEIPWGLVLPEMGARVKITFEVDG